MYETRAIDLDAGQSVDDAEIVVHFWTGNIEKPVVELWKTSDPGGGVVDISGSEFTIEFYPADFLRVPLLTRDLEMDVEVELRRNGQVKKEQHLLTVLASKIPPGWSPPEL